MKIVKKTTATEEVMEVKVVCASVRAVFSNDYLREKILEMAISDRDPQKRIDRKTLVNVRQVQTSWRDTVSRSLSQLKEPLYTVKLDEVNSLTGAPFVQANGKELDRFTAFFAGRDETFSLKLCEEFFRLENYDSLFTCLKPCSKDLVQLELMVPGNVGSFPSVFPNVCLPNLQKLSVTFQEQENDNHSSTSFLVTLLLQSPNLSDFINLRNCVPGFSYLALPPTLRKIRLGFPMRSEHLQIFERNSLSALTELDLTGMGLTLSRETLFNVLSQCKDTLKVLAMAPGYEEVDWRHVRNVVKFPEMKKLENIQLIEFIIELDDETKANLNKYLPNLKKLSISMTTRVVAAVVEALASWTEKERFERLETFSLLALTLIGTQNGDQSVRILPNILETILQGMPKVRDVTLTLDGKHPADLVPLFEKRGQIKTLRIILENRDCIKNSDVWDALLTGIPQEVTKAIRLNPSFEENFEIVEKNEAVPSIRLLTNLRSLNLGCYRKGGTCARIPLISKLAFKYAFQKMPALKVLSLHDRFKVSQEVAKQWKKSGGDRSIRQK